MTELDESAPPDVSIPSDSAQSLEPVLAAEPTGAPTDLGIGPEVSPDEAVAELMRTAVASDAVESSSLPADLAPVLESPGESSVPYLAASSSADTPDGSGTGGIDPNPMDSPGPSTETEDPRPPFTASVPDSIESGTTSTPEHVPETPSTGSEPAPPVREEPLTTGTVEPVAISPEGESAGATLAERTDASEPPLGVPPYRTDSEPLVVPPVTPTPEPGGEIAPSIERLGVDLPILERTNEPNPELRPEEGLSSPESQREETALPDLGPPGSELSVPVPLPETSPLPLEEFPALAPAETPRSDAIVAPESSTALDSIAPEEAPTVEQEPVGSEGAPVQPLPAEIPPPGAVEPIRAPPEAVAVAPTASDAPTNEGAPALESAAPPAVESPSPPPSPIPSPTPELGSVRSALFSIPAPAPVVSAPPPPVVVPPPPPSGVEIDFSSALFMALQPFLDATAAGHKGIALVRELPERIRVHIGPRPVEVYWLTNLDRPRTVRPSDLGAMAQRFHRALEDDGVTAVFLEGVEYLVGIHGVERVGAFLREIDALARQHVARVWLHLTPSLMSEAGLDQLLATVRAPPPGEAGASPADPSTAGTDSS